MSSCMTGIQQKIRSLEDFAEANFHIPSWLQMIKCWWFSNQTHQCKEKDLTHNTKLVSPHARKPHRKGDCLLKLNVVFMYTIDINCSILVCGGHLMAKTTVKNIFSHSQYGDVNYDNKEDCDWIIEAPPGRRRGFTIQCTWIYYVLTIRRKFTISQTINYNSI